VTLTGHFDHSKEMHLWPRALYLGEGSSKSNEYGAYVVTPFYSEELGRYVLINRGWVPKRKMPPATRNHGQVSSVEEYCIIGHCIYVERACY